VEWRGVLAIGSKNTDKNNIKKQKIFLLIGEIKHFKGPTPQWH